MIFRTRRFIILGFLALSALLCATAAAQLEPPSLPGDVLAGPDSVPQVEKVKASAYFTTAAGGKPAILFVTADVAPDWHIYSITQKPGGPNKSRIKLTASPDFKLAGEFKPEKQPAVHKYDDVWPGLSVEEHEGRVTWSAPIELAADADPAKLEIAGAVNAQVCAKECLPPRDYKFTARLKGRPPAAAAGASTSAPRDTSATDTSAKNLIPAPLTSAIGLPALKVRVLSATDVAQQSLWMVLLSAFLGGLILNLMPCVLPVIGLKILSFVEQSHHSRRQILVLNLWYTLGLMSVFLVLATLACGASLGFRSQNLGWGEQFSSPAFNIVMCGLVFVMALSFLGVWEIPIPGFAGHGKAANLANQEGPAGAFTKGVMSTVLATPCSGPFLGSVFGFLLRQPPAIIYAIFTAIGLGMASPYLVIGAFPRLIRALPKPGAWMDTFKHLMGFVLLGTVVFLFTFLKHEYLAATFGMLVGLWAACWWIGRVPLTAELGTKLISWAQGAVFAALVGWISFASLAPGSSLLLWQPYSPDTLAKYRAEGKTVMVDFSADWCLTCKANLKFAINTADVFRLVQANGVVTLLADWTDGSPEIKSALAALDSNSIPVLAIFPASRPGEAIVLRDLISKNDVLQALHDAGPSKVEIAEQTAMK